MTYRLCTTCVRRRDCVYRKGRRSVYLCEEFEGERPHSPRRVEKAQPVGAR